MKTYIEIDLHNPCKGHHIKFDEDGNAFYNQAIRQMREGDERGKPTGDWADFYEDEPVKVGQYGHGYQIHINAAYRKWLKDQPLVPGNYVKTFLNQANREVEILAISGDEALGIYEMPAGRRFFAVMDRNTKKWKRSQTLKTMPAKWTSQLDKAELESIQES